MSDLKAKIAGELYKAIKHTSNDGELLSIVGSYGDTLDDDDVLNLLKAWNNKRAIKAEAAERRTH